MKPAPARAAHGGEVWLLAAPARERAPELASAFASAPPALCLAGAEPEARAAAEALARALGHGDAPGELVGTPEALLHTLVTTLEGGAGRVLAVLTPPMLTALVARALELAPGRSAPLRVDPGRLCLLRVEPEGFVLRRANVLAPERTSGTALPTGRDGAR